MLDNMSRITLTEYYGRPINTVEEAAWAEELAEADRKNRLLLFMQTIKDAKVECNGGTSITEALIYPETPCPR